MFVTFDPSLSAIDRQISLADGNKRTRLKTGCTTCRRRKKKCDETRPRCNYCEARGLACEWGIKRVSFESLENRVHKAKPARNRTSISLDKCPTPITIDSHGESQFETLITPEPILGVEPMSVTDTNPTIEVSNSPASPQLIDQLTDQPLELSTSLTQIQPHDYPEFDFSFLIEPLLVANLYLDDAGINYLHYFEHEVAPLLSVLPSSSNYFLKTFFAAAHDHELISQAIAAWGALFRDHDIDIVNEYLGKARKLLVRANKSSADADLALLFVQFAFYLISLGIQVCLGDVHNWYGLFNKCVGILKKVGGVNKFLERYQYSNDAKFLVANFQCHDIMLLTGATVCSINSYLDVVRILEYSEDYGVDPFQGCTQPLGLLLGEMTNIYQNFRSTRDELELRMARVDVDNSDLPFARLQHYMEVEKQYNSLLIRVTNAKPLNNLGHIDSPLERNAHMKLFEVFRNTCKLFLFLYFKQVAPSAIDIQQILLSQLQLMEGLAVMPRLVLCLNMAIIISGVAALTEYDRDRIQRLVDTVYENYSVGNVRRIRELLRIIWRRNPQGNIVVDWMELCNELGWNLSVC